jgi:DivIVA domain-containing protein
MLFDEITLTPQELLEKEFKIDTRGYRPQEVDRFLDVIINDYTKFVSIIKKLENENKDIIEENMRLKHELRNTKDKLEIVKSSGKEVTNIDLLRRISQLEKVIFGEDTNNNL